MKIRQGFVSNSSSSSFIVIFPREPKSRNDVKNFLFGKDVTHFGSPYDDDASYTTDQVAETVWTDIMSQDKNNLSHAEDLASNGIEGDDAPNYNLFHVNGKTDWQGYQEASRKYGIEKLKSFFNTRKIKLQKIEGQEPDEVFYIFEYSDNDGSYFSALEHGGLFDNLRYLRISHH